MSSDTEDAFTALPALAFVSRKRVYFLMSYKCRGKLERKIKAVEMPSNDFSITRLTEKFSAVCGGTVALQYKGKTLLTDDDVKKALVSFFLNFFFPRFFSLIRLI